MQSSSGAAGTRPDLDAAVRYGLERARGEVLMAGELALSGDGRRLAFTAEVVVDPTRGPRRRVGVLDVRTRQVSWHPDTSIDTHGPSWAADGGQLAWIASRADGTVLEICTGGAGERGLAVDDRRTLPADLHPEYVRLAPSGTHLLVGVAEAGAELSDVVGSGTVGSAGSSAGWRPDVSDGAPTPGRRHLWVVPIATDTQPRRVGPRDRTVWQADWAGEQHVVLTGSTGSSESDWYTAQLSLLDLGTGDLMTVEKPTGQVVAPAASPSGRRLSAVVGAMSDRGLDSGTLVVHDTATGARLEADTAGIDVSDQHWTGEGRVVVAGLRGLQTVVAEYDVERRTLTELWHSSLTCGTMAPAVAATAGSVVACVHGYTRAPQLCALTAEGERPLLTLNATTPPRPADDGTIEELHWRSSDGVTIDGLLVSPSTPGPHPLVVNVHGGPVAAWRNSWTLLDPYTRLLVGRGYAVLHPNIRGSSGRGQQFVLAGLRDMGGQDAADLLTGVASLVAAGRVDAVRVGVTGNSYGGFLSAWLVATSDAFAAAVSRSPVTDWVSQHHASNLPGFDRLCLAGDPLAVDSDYRSRSPLYLADRVRTPVLLMAGGRDLATPPEQAAMFHRALVERGRPSTLVIYPEEGHGVRARDAIVDQCTRILDFFDRHMPAGS